MVASQTKSLTETAQQTRAAAFKLAILSTDDRNSALEAVAKALEAATPRNNCRQRSGLKGSRVGQYCPRTIFSVKAGTAKIAVGDRRS